MDGHRLPTALVSVLVCAVTVRADTFTYLDDQQQPQSVEARLVASARGVHVLGRADGQYVIVPQSRLQTRVAGEDPAPISVDAMVGVLKEEFGPERIRVMTEDAYVVGLVLAGPLPTPSETAADMFLRNAARFMKNVERVFTGFCRELRLDAQRPEFPLVLLVFETDRDFNECARRVTGGRGLAAENMAGFYSPLSNWLAIRIGECRTFQVPLHEAIHQQVYNRGLFQRLARVPVWFNEGIAAGFENDGLRIDIGPTKVNATYARKVSQATKLDWNDVFLNDAVFTGDVLSGEAYVHAWSLHWLLVTQHRREYSRYFRLLGQIAPLAEQSPAERKQQFVDTFGKTVGELHGDFPRLLQAAMRREKVSPNGNDEKKNATFADASEVKLTTVKRTGDDGMIEVRGTLKNVSPFRDLAYYVTVQTDGGLYAEWHLPSVESLTERPLNKRLVEKAIEGGPARTGKRYWVEVTCALPSSPEAEQWRRGEFPKLTWEEPAR